MQPRNLRMLIGIALSVAMACGAPARAAELRQETLEAWKRYERLTEERIASELEAEEGFLVQDFFSQEERSKCTREVAAGRVCVQPMRTLAPGGDELEVPRGLIHHWMGSIRIPNADLDELLAWVQDYDGHERYFEEVEDSRLLSRDGDAFRIFMRLRRKKVVTVYYHTEHDAVFSRQGPRRASSRSHATRIAELERAGTDRESEKKPGSDSGYLWRLDSYWRYMADGEDVVVSLESISLSRALPPLVGGLIKGFVNSVPRESVERTLKSLRHGFARNRSSAPRQGDGGAGPQ